MLTHAHEDHFGAVIELWPRLQAPIYATPFTAALLKAKLAEFGGRLKLPIHEVEMGRRFTVGPFDVELVTMAHSIPEPNGLLLRTPHGTVFHTGDWKLDPSPVLGPPADEAKIAALGGEGVLALVCDSTNAFRDGRSPSESDVARSLARIVKGAQRCVAVTTFASNVGRIKAIAEAARGQAGISWLRGARCIASFRWRSIPDTCRRISGISISRSSPTSMPTRCWRS